MNPIVLGAQSSVHCTVSDAKGKTQVNESRLIHERNYFSSGVMVSVAVGKKGKSSLIFVNQESKETKASTGRQRARRFHRRDQR